MWSYINESISEWCGSPFWDTNLTWNSSDPDFTPCFERTALVWLPSLFLLLFTPLEIYFERSSNSSRIPFNRYNVFKLIIIAFAGISALANNVHYIYSNEKRNTVDFYSSLIKFFTFYLFFELTYFNVRSGIRSSGTLFVFSLLALVCETPQMRTELKSGVLSDLNKAGLREVLDFTSYSVYYLSTLIIFVLNCYADSRPVLQIIQENKCPELDSSFLSKFVFAWFNDLAWKGFRQLLTSDDLWEVDNDLCMANVARKFESNWRQAKDRLVRKNRAERVVREAENEILVENEFGQESADFEDKKEVSLLFPLCQTFGGHYLYGAIFRVVFSSLLCVSPEILKLIIGFIRDKKEFLWRGYMYAVMLLVVAVTRTLFLNQYFHVMFRLGQKIRTTLIFVIYKKSLKISNGTKNCFSAGEINNLMAVDAERFVNSSLYISMLWAAPMEVGTAMYLLYNILGSSVFAGAASMAVIIPFNAYMAAISQRLQKKRMEFKDDRVKYMTEVLHGIKVLKLYAWEPKFEEHISKIRDNEIGTMRGISYIEAIARFLWSLAPTLATVITFAVYVLSSTEHILDVPTAFVSFALFNSLKMPLSQLPPIIGDLTQTWVSAKRISKFLNAEELDPNATSHEPRHEPIIIENGRFSWRSDDAPSVLHNINVNVETGHLVAVVGAVGAGKSSLLSALLGEMYKQSGFINTTGTLAYIPQESWIRNETFKANITLGDSRKTLQFHELILNACALRADLKILSDGDQTEIGEKGANLSGGQKQRISLARAVYADADTYLFDDPLSAVDSHVGKHIFEQVIGPTGLLKNKTRILVTHNITYLPHVDFIIVLSDGTISESGTYEELAEKKGDFANFLANFMTEETNNIEDKNEPAASEFRNGDDFRKRLSSIPSLSDDDSVISESGVVDVGGRKLIVDEEMEIGSVKFAVYQYFVKAIGLFWTLTIFFFSIIFITLTVVHGLWLSAWSTDKAASDKRYFYLGGYALLGVALACSAFAQVASVYLAILKGAKSLHDYLLTAVLRWPALAFDKIPTGRIINRFSADIEVLDSQLVSNLEEFLRLTVQVISTLFVISYSTPQFLFIIVLLGIVYGIVQRFFITTARQLRRIESVSKSPIFSLFGETLEGASSIRAYCLQTRFIRDSEKKIDKSIKCSYLGFVANRWLSVRLETLGSLITFSSAIFAVISRSTLSPGLAALSITYSIHIANSLYVWVRMIAEIETNIVAVERLKKYVDMEQEKPWKLPDDDSIMNNWPDRGEIVFSDLNVRYQDCLDPVLKGISFTVNSGQKVGIVGRTGAGKSSLTLCLFRIIESCGGRIDIDGIDIARLGLHTLRGRLTIIPQDPTLFTGTLRMNLDPTETFSDECLWNALEMTDLKKYLSSLNHGLDYRVTEGGSNFSVGQRQLICLARALLRKTKVLILDEATAAIDMETDALIQTTIRKEFEGSTVLTVAHRLNTVLDYDRILVLDTGSVVEYDSPKKLLQNEASIFSKMAADAGLICKE